MPQPRAEPGTLGDLTGFLLWEMGLGMSADDALALAQPLFPGVEPINMAYALNVSESALKLGDLATTGFLTPGRQPYMVPVIPGAPEGYNYQVVVSVINRETGDQEEREMRIQSDGPIGYNDICEQASQQVDFYTSDSPKWRNLERVVAAPEGFSSFQCTVTAVYRG